MARWPACKQPAPRRLTHRSRRPNQPLSPLDAEFIKLVLSKQGQEVVVKDGYIPLPSKVVEKTMKELGL